MKGHLRDSLYLIAVLFLTRFLFNFINVAEAQFQSATDNKMMDFAIRIKSIKCIVNVSKVKLNFCYVKAHSRTLTSVNVGAELLEDFVAPSKVRYELTKFMQCTPLIFLVYSQIFVSFHYRFGLIYREVLAATFDYCEKFKNGQFISNNPLGHLLYNGVKDSIPDLFKQGCPIVKQVKIVENIFFIFRFLSKLIIELHVIGFQR